MPGDGSRALWVAVLLAAAITGDLACSTTLLQHTGESLLAVKRAYRELCIPDPVADDAAASCARARAQINIAVTEYDVPNEEADE